MYILDSNIIIYSALPEYAYLRPLLKDPAGCVSIFSKLEVLGYHRLEATGKRYFESAFYSLTTLPVNSEIMDVGISIRQQRKLSAGDAIIAATALHYDIELLTRNIDDFEWIPELILRNPVK